MPLFSLSISLSSTIRMLSNPPHIGGIPSPGSFASSFQGNKVGSERVLLYWVFLQFSSVAQLCLTLFDARPPCPSPTPGVHSEPCPLSQWCHPAICCPLLLPPILPSIRVFPSESTLRMRWPKYWSFSFSIRTDLQNGLVGSPCSPRDSQESSPTPQFKSINSSAPSLLHSRTLTVQLLEKP